MFLYVDGGCRVGVDDYALASVVDADKKDVIINNLDLLQDFNIIEKELPTGTRHVIKCKFNDVKAQNNNGAELLALTAGLRIALFGERSIRIIYSDSQLLIQYWSRAHINQRTKRKMDPEKIRYITECSELRKEFESKGGKILYISGASNLADLFGKH